MSDRHNVTIKVDEQEQKVSVYRIAKSLTEEQFVELMEDYNNTSANEFERGKRIGIMLQNSHRTLQGSVIRLLFGILSGLGETVYTDARNEVGIESCRKVKRMIEEDEIKLGYMI